MISFCKLNQRLNRDFNHLIKKKGNEDFIEVNEDESSEFLEGTINFRKYMVGSSAFSETIGYLKVSRQMCSLWQISGIAEK